MKPNQPPADDSAFTAATAYPISEAELDKVVKTAVSSMTDAEKEEALRHAIELIYEVMTDQINDADECEKYLRAYAPRL